MNENNQAVKITISRGNRKMGAIPSVSLPPVITCAPGAPCVKKCYACKMCRLYPSVRASYQRNLDALNENWDEYWRQVRAAVAKAKYFRFHVSGDIPCGLYFCDMIHTAKENPHCEILCFTKQYNIVNTWLDQHGEGLPENLHIIFSLWDTPWNVRVNNPHDMPKSAVIFKSGGGAAYDKVCGGNCYECACQGVGCWELKKGETIAFYEH